MWMLRFLLATGLLSLLGPESVVAASGLAEKLEALVQSHRGEIAVAVKHLETGESFAHRADTPQATASLIKFPVMVAAHQLAARGEVSLDQELELREEDKVPGSGILTSHFSPGLKLRLRDAIRLMIAYSDNTATNLVLDRIGLSATNELMDELGLKETRIHAKVYRRDTSIHPERSERFGLGSTTANDMIALCERLHSGVLGSSESTRAMLEHLRACEDRQKLQRWLPQDAVFAHKTGAVNNVRCDAGIMETKSGPVAICVLTERNKDSSWGEKNEAETLCAEIGKLVFEHFGGASTNEVTVARELKQGSSGPLVEALQRTLNARLSPSPHLSVDGDFGPNTRSAVVAFQHQMGIAEDGIVTKAFWEKLGPIVSAEEATTDLDPTASQSPAPLEPAESLEGPPLVTCESWAVVDGVTGDLLYSHQADAKREPASTTKMMTALLVMEHALAHPDSLDEIVTFSKDADETPGSTSELKAGEQVSVRDLLYGLLLPSGNDASVALAEHFGDRLGTDLAEEAGIGRFVAAMNRRAKELGLQQTEFRNPHGLSVAGHHSSARDLATIAWHAMQIPQFRDIVSTREWKCLVQSEIGYSRQVTWRNTNQLLKIEGYSGVKTGTTEAAGACLVSWGERKGRNLIVVVLGSAASESRYTDSRNLYRWAWTQLESEGTSGTRGN